MSISSIFFITNNAVARLLCCGCQSEGTESKNSISTEKQLEVRACSRRDLARKQDDQSAHRCHLRTDWDPMVGS